MPAAPAAGPRSIAPEGVHAEATLHPLAAKLGVIFSQNIPHCVVSGQLASPQSLGLISRKVSDHLWKSVQYSSNKSKSDLLLNWPDLGPLF